MLADLPGFQRPRDPLTERMQRTVDASFEDVDAVLFVVDARDRIGAGDRFIAQRVFALGVPVVIAVNKVDRLKPGHIASQMQTAAQLGRLPRAPSGEREDRRRHRRAARGARRPAARGAAVLPAGAAHRPARSRRRSPSSSASRRCALTREEVPHAVTAEVEELDDKVVRASLYVETESQKQILVGKSGAMVQADRHAARGPRSRRCSAGRSSSTCR